MYCHKCGKAIPDNSVFCSNCGHIVKEETYEHVKAVPNKSTHHTENESSHTTPETVNTNRNTNGQSEKNLFSIFDIKTKKLNPIPEEVEQFRYIFEVYAQENISLKRLLNLLVSENKNPLDGSHWTTAKLSTILRNPIYVKADADIYDYYESNGVQMISGVEQFTGEFGAQLYGQNKHKADAPDCSDMKLVLLSHAGIVDSTIWLRCQRKLEKNRQIGKSCSNQTSWLAGKVICEKCGHGMTIIKGKPDKNGNFRRYFNCTGRSHKKMLRSEMYNLCRRFRADGL